MKERNNVSQLDNHCIFLASKWLDTIDDHINLVRVCKRLKLNMEKFFFNPVSLNSRTREYFPKIQTLIQYKSTDCLFNDDKRIIKRQIIGGNVFKNEKICPILEFLTGLHCGNVIFDSGEDSWSIKTSVLNKKNCWKK